MMQFMAVTRSLRGLVISTGERVLWSYVPWWHIKQDICLFFRLLRGVLSWFSKTCLCFNPNPVLRHRLSPGILCVALETLLTLFLCHVPMCTSLLDLLWRKLMMPCRFSLLGRQKAQWLNVKYVQIHIKIRVFFWLVHSCQPCVVTVWECASLACLQGKPLPDTFHNDGLNCTKLYTYRRILLN